MTTEPLAKLIIVNNHHIQDDVLHFNFEQLEQFLKKKEFELIKQINDPDIYIYNKIDFKANPYVTHIHFGFSDRVQRVLFYNSKSV